MKDHDTLLAMKSEEHKEGGIPFDGEFYSWDHSYYGRKFVEATLALGDALVKEYFPVSAVVPTILEIYQKLLRVQFEELKGETWHPDVQMFSVWEDGAKDESGFIGYCYLDLFPRGMSALINLPAIPWIPPSLFLFLLDFDPDDIMLPCIQRRNTHT